MINKALTDLKNKQIDEATAYFVDELNPAYDASYDLMNVPIKELGDIKNLDNNAQKEKVNEFVEYMRNREITLKNARELVKNKSDIFEKMKFDFEFDGFNLKEMDNRINKILK